MLVDASQMSNTFSEIPDPPPAALISRGLQWEVKRLATYNIRFFHKILLQVIEFSEGEADIDNCDLSQLMANFGRR